jgi:hypothetical protein
VNSALGATPEEWGHFEWVLGLRGNLLPVVPDEHAMPTPGSKVAKFGKIPSAYDKDGHAYGLKDWQKREILDNEVALWRQDSRLGLCVRTGSKSGVYAIDVDVTDPTLAAQIAEQIHTIDDFIQRTRANSPKFLVPIEIEGAPELSKRILETEHGRIEFLADGQQFVAAGTHPSGARYDWGGLPHEFPRLTLKRFEQLWADLQTRFGGDAPDTKSSDKSGGAHPTDNTLLTEISAEDLISLKSALAYKPLLKAAGDNDVWSEVGSALLSLGPIGKELWITFSQNAAGYEPGAPEKWWETHYE